MRINTESEVASAERVLRLSWVIVFGAVLFSVLTVTPLVERVTTDEWDWTAPILPIVVDAAVVIVVRIDAIIARLGGRPGGWSAALRWLTGALTLALNIGDSALKGDMVGVGVHVVAPILLIVTAEATLTYRRAINAAVERIERERAADRERQARERREREDRSRADRETEREAARLEREQEQAAREREREQDARLAREAREHEVNMAAQAREHEARLDRERRDDEARQRREEADRTAALRREDDQRKERERKAREAEAARRAALARPKAAEPVSAAVSTPRPAVSASVSTGAHEAPADDKMSEADARQAVADAIREGRSQRQVAALTGWSTGWVAKRFQEAEKPSEELEAQAA